MWMFLRTKVQLGLTGQGYGIKRNANHLRRAGLGRRRLRWVWR